MFTPAEIAEDVETSFIPASEQTEAVRAAIIAAIEADRAQFFDTAGSASRQHYIDTGRYMLHEEVAEMERINKR